MVLAHTHQGGWRFVPVSPDPKVWENPSNIEIVLGYHDSAFACMRSVPKSTTRAGQQCCYDINLNLITDMPDAGTADLVSPGVSRIDHYTHDVAPWNCAEWLESQQTFESGFIAKYFEVRPANTGENCE